MEDKINKILHDAFNKYDVPDEAIVGATNMLTQLLKNPSQHRTGATIMTEAASRAGDPGVNGKSKPEVL